MCSSRRTGRNRWAQGGGVSHETHDGTWVDGGGRIIYDWMGRYAGSPYHQYLGSPITTLGGMHWLVPEDDQLFGTASLNKQHVPGNGPLDDDTLQREQASFWMAHQIGLRRAKPALLRLLRQRQPPRPADGGRPGARCAR